MQGQEGLRVLEKLILELVKWKLNEKIELPSLLFIGNVS